MIGRLTKKTLFVCSKWEQPLLFVCGRSTQRLFHRASDPARLFSLLPPVRLPFNPFANNIGYFAIAFA